MKEFLQEIGEQVVEFLSENVGVHSASEYRDRLDFVLAYIVLANDARYSAMEINIHTAQYKDYLAKKLEELKLAKDKEVKDDEDVVLAEAEDKKVEAPDSLDELLASEPIVIADVIELVSSINPAAIPAVVAALTTPTSDEEQFEKTPDFTVQTAAALNSIAVQIQATVTEDSGAMPFNFITEAMAQGLSQAEATEVFNSFFPPAAGNVHMQLPCNFITLNLYRANIGPYLIGDMVVEPIPSSQNLAQGAFGSDDFVFINGFAITFTINGMNDAPNIVPFFSGIDEDGVGGTFSLLTGISDIDGDPITLSGVSFLNDTQNAFTFNSMTNNVMLATSGYDVLAQGASQIITVNYTASDGMVNTPTSTSITVTGVNDLPVLPFIGPSAISEDGALPSISLTAGVTDPDAVALDVLPGSVNIMNDVLGGLIFNNALNQLDITPNAYNSFQVGQSQVITVAYSVFDGFGSTPGNLQITINGANDAPTSASINDVGAGEDDVVFALPALSLATFFDVDTGDSGTVSGLTLNTLPAALGGGPLAFTFNPGTQVLTLLPTAGQFDVFTQGSINTVTFNAVVQDSQGAAVPGFVNLNVNIAGVNDLPVVPGLPAVNLSEDSAGSFVELITGAGITDPDAVALDVVGGSVSIVNDPSTGVAFNDGLNRMVITPSAYNGLQVGSSQVITFNYSVFDGFGSTLATPIMVTINGANDAPTAATIADLPAALEDAVPMMFAGLTTSSFTDADTVDTVGTISNVVVGSLPAVLGALDITYTPGTSTLTLDNLAQLDVFDPGVVNTITFNATVEDSQGAAVPGVVTFDLAVTGVNDAPTSADGMVAQDTVDTALTPARINDTFYTFQTSDFTFVDPDTQDAGGLTSIRIVTVPTIGDLTIGGAVQGAGTVIPVAVIPTLRHEAAFNEGGFTDATFTFKVIDASGAESATQTMTVAILNTVPFIEWSLMGDDFTTLPTFVVEDGQALDDQVQHPGVGVSPNLINLNSYLRDAESDDPFFFGHTNVPGWVTIGGFSGGFLTGTAPTQAIPGGQTTSILAPGVLTTITYNQADSGGSTPEMRTLDIQQFRLDFDVLNEVTNAPLGGGTQISEDFFDFGFGTVNLFRTPGVTISDLADAVDFSTVSGNYAISVTGAGGTNTVEFSSNPAAMTGDLTNFNVTMTTGIDPTVNTPFTFAVHDNADSNTVPTQIIGPSTGADAIHGLGGADWIFGFGAAAQGDVAVDLEGTSVTLIRGGEGDDRIYGDTDQNILAGGSGANNILFGGPGNDFLIGDAGNEVKAGGTGGDDILFGGTGNDFLAGEAINGNFGVDGQNTFIYDLTIDNGNDTILEFDNVDIASTGDPQDTIAIVGASGTAITDLASALGPTTSPGGEFQFAINDAGAGTILFVEVGLSAEQHRFTIDDGTGAVEYAVILNDIDIAEPRNPGIASVLDKATNAMSPRGTYEIDFWESDGSYLLSYADFVVNNFITDGTPGTVTNDTLILDFGDSAIDDTNIENYTRISDSGVDLDGVGGNDILLEIFEDSSLTNMNMSPIADIYVNGISFNEGDREISNYFERGATSGAYDVGDDIVIV